MNAFSIELRPRGRRRRALLTGGVARGGLYHRLLRCQAFGLEEAWRQVKTRLSGCPVKGLMV